jgi:mannose-6-phosphate isomerase-like protein (cupin superfamily)
LLLITPPDKLPAMKILIILAALPLMAADPAGFASWTSADIQSRAKAAKLDEHKAGADRVANWGNHGLLIVRREGDGEAEIHENQVDVITVVSGEGTLVVGGTAVDTHPTTAGEIRGKSITGGTNHKMAAGDVFHIPAKVPHQMLVPKSLVIQVVKVDSK